MSRMLREKRLTWMRLWVDPFMHKGESFDVAWNHRTHFDDLTNIFGWHKSQQRDDEVLKLKTCLWGKVSTRSFKRSSHCDKAFLNKVQHIQSSCNLPFSSSTQPNFSEFWRQFVTFTARAALAPSISGYEKIFSDPIHDVFCYERIF